MAEETFSLEELYNIPNPMFATLWELEETGNTETSLKYYFTDAKIPFDFPKLTTEKLPTGLNYYKDYEYDRDVTLTMREDMDMNTYAYFKKWFSSIYDRENEVINLGAENFTRNFVLTLQRFVIDTSKLEEFRWRNMANAGVNALSAVTSKAIPTATWYARKLLNVVNHDPDSNNLVHMATQSIANAGIEVGSGVAQKYTVEAINSLRKTDSLQKIQTLATVTLSGCLIKEIGDGWSFSYDSNAEPVTYDVTMSCDDIEVEIENSSIGGYSDESIR